MRAVIYARYSSDNQTEASIEGQLRECMEYATYENRLIHSFDDLKIPSFFYFSFINF